MTRCPERPVEAYSILVVEDDRLIARCFKEVLLANGYRLCGIVRTGEEAVLVALRERPDLILMDIKLDGVMDGLAAAEGIRRLSEIPIIFISACTTTETIGMAMKLGPQGFIAKPFRLEKLLGSIGKVLSRRPAENELAGASQE